MRTSVSLVSFALMTLCALHSSLSLNAQNVSATKPLGIVPESGYLSYTKYTNAFFGFSLPLPSGAVLQEQTLSLSRGAGEHFIFGFHSANKELISFTITAVEVRGAPDRAAKRIAAAGESSKAAQIEIAGKHFWTSQSPPVRGSASVTTVVFTTAVERYVIEFKITSLNPATTAELKRNVEGLSFFEPSTSKLVAGPQSRAYSPGTTFFAPNLISHLDAGTVSQNTYWNSELRFHYVFPQDWVVVSKAVPVEFSGAGVDFRQGNSPTLQRERDAASQCTKTLLFVRKYLQNPENERFNPMALVIAADPRCISESSFPKSIEDRNSAQQIARDVLAYFRTAELVPTAAARVRAFNNANRTMIEISQPSSLQSMKLSAPVSISYSLLMMESAGYWVIWRFAADSETQLQELKRTKVFFDDMVEFKPDSTIP